MVDDLKLDVEHAEAIVEKGIEFEVYTDSMPDSDADKMEAAHEIVAFAIDAWVTDKVRPDSDTAKIAKAGKQIVEIFEYAGITPDKKGKLKFGPLPEFEGGEDDDDGSDDGDGETAFNVDDTIEDYSEMNGKQRLAAVEEVMGEEGEGLYEEQVQGLLDYENEQEKPSAKVVELLETILADDGSDDDADDAAGEDDDDDTKAEGDDDDGEGEEGGEPFDGYDDANMKDIKEALVAAAQDEDEPLEVSQVEYVIDYEKANKNRSSFIKWLNELKGEMEEGDGDDDDAEPEPEPTKKKAGAKKVAPKADSNGSSTITLTRDEILTALSEGEVTVEVG